MAIGIAGTYSNVNAPATVGAQSVTDVTIPVHTAAIVFFHFYNSDIGSFINNSASLPVLGGATCTHIGTIANSVQNAAQAFWATGSSVGASQTLSYTVTDTQLVDGPGISIVFLSGSETTGLIRASATDSDDNGASTSGALTFVANDWTILGYTADISVDGTNGGANTAGIAQYNLTDGPPLRAGVYYKTDNGTISLPSASSSFMAIVAMTVKPTAAGAGVSPSVSEAVTLTESVSMKMDLGKVNLNEAVTVADVITMHMPIAVRMYKP